MNNKTIEWLLQGRSWIEFRKEIQVIKALLNELGA